MIEVYKIVSGKYDSAITPTLIISDTHKTRGIDLRLQKSRLVQIEAGSLNRSRSQIEAGGGNHLYK